MGSVNNQDAGLIEKIARREISKAISDNLRKLVDPHGRVDVNQMKHEVSSAKENTSVQMPTGSSAHETTNMNEDHDHEYLRSDGDSQPGSSGMGGRTIGALQNRMEHPETQGADVNPMASGSGNGQPGGTMSDVTSRLRGGLKMFRRGKDSSVVRG